MNISGVENGIEQKLEDGLSVGVTRRQFLGLVGGAATVAAVGGGAASLLAGCSSKAATPTSTSMASSSSTAANTPKYGGTLHVASPSPGANIGWPATNNGGGDHIQSYYETLVRSNEKGNLIPWLAESYKVAEDRKSITFTIRKGVKFTDGSDLTADVVKWNLDQFAKRQTNWISIEVVDPSTVRVSLKAWDSSVLASFGDVQPGLFMVSKAAYDKNGQDWLTTHPVGTGAFSVSSYVTDSSSTLVKNPNYWGKDANGHQLPYLDGMAFTFTADATTQLMMAKSGEVDMVISVSPGKQMADFKKIGWATHTTYDSNEVWIPDSAHADSPWSKLEVREAAEYAVDRATIAKKFGYGYLEAPNQIPPRSTAAYQANYSLGRNYDPAKAKQLLTQAGYPNGFKTSLIVWQGGSRDIALAEQQYLLAVGIQADVVYADMAKWTSYVGPTGRYHNALLEAPSPAQGPTGLGCVSFVVSNFGNNWEKPAEFTKAYEAATSALTPDASLVRAATDVLTKNALLIPLYEGGSGRVEKSQVVAEFGHRGLPLSSLETAWLNK